jgi:integrase
MSVRKRTWTTGKDEKREAWIVDYVDQTGERRLKTFATKKEADAWKVTALHEIQQGVHTPESKSITVAEAAEDWIAYVTNEKRERSTIESYRSYVDNHINPRLGREKLSRLTTPRLQAFRDDLLAGLSRPHAKKVLTSLKSLLSDAQRRGNVAQNVALPIKIAPDTQTCGRG